MMGILPGWDARHVTANETSITSGAGWQRKPEHRAQGQFAFDGELTAMHFDYARGHRCRC
jgi:hypothetical protein